MRALVSYLLSTIYAVKDNICVVLDVGMFDVVVCCAKAEPPQP
jgi:hypothetical protein